MEYKFEDLLLETILYCVYESTQHLNYLKTKMIRERDFSVIDSHRYTVRQKIQDKK